MMDPKATLHAADEELLDGSPGEARRFLDSYRGWRARGGFEPKDLGRRGRPGVSGDQYYAALVARFADRFPGYPVPKPLEV